MDKKKFFNSDIIIMFFSFLYLRKKIVENFECVKIDKSLFVLEKLK